MVSFPNSITNMSTFQQFRSTQIAIQKLGKTLTRNVGTKVMVYVKTCVHVFNNVLEGADSSTTACQPAA